ncbi:DNA topoisomerase 2 [Camellia lanceoleosa]|nr:DNA topoisomerase 2 [Camellia lanceoleosa]
MESSDNENHATKFVNDLEIIEEKAAAEGEVGGGGGGIEEVEGEEGGGGGEGEGEGEGEAEKVGGGGGGGGAAMEKQYWKYAPLYKAALTGDWEEAKRIINGDRDALTAKITQDNEIALHVAVATGPVDESKNNLPNILCVIQIECLVQQQLLVMIMMLPPRVVNGAMQGINGTVFAYDVTSSGKTHTMHDHDGSHIKGLLINFIHSFWPSLLKIPSFLVEFITPIVKPKLSWSNKSVVKEGFTKHKQSSFLLVHLPSVVRCSFGLPVFSIGFIGFNLSLARSFQILEWMVLKAEDFHSAGFVDKQWSLMQLFLVCFRLGCDGGRDSGETSGCESMRCCVEREILKAGSLTECCLTRSVLVSNGVLHDKLLERIGPPTDKLKNKGIDFSLWFKPENYHTDC